MVIALHEKSPRCPLRIIYTGIIIIHSSLSRCYVYHLSKYIVEGPKYNLLPMLRNISGNFKKYKINHFFNFLNISSNNNIKQKHCSI